MQRNNFDELKLLWAMIPKEHPRPVFGAGFAISAMMPMCP